MGKNGSDLKRRNRVKRALVIGGHGTLGKAIVAKLNELSVEVVTAGRSSGDYQVDMTSTDSIKALFEAVQSILIMSLSRLGRHIMPDWKS